MQWEFNFLILKIHISCISYKTSQNNIVVGSSSNSVEQIVLLSYKKVNEDYPIFATEIRPSRCSIRNDGNSPCLTAKMGTGGNNVPVLVKENRKLTVRECLRLQGFPEDYKIRDNYSQSYKQIGNSVTVPVVTLIAEEMIKYLN